MRRCQKNNSTLPFDFLRPQEILLYHRRYLQAAAEKLGFSTIEEAIIKTYRQTGSIRKTAVLLDSSYATMQAALVKLGEPIKRRGGNNNPYGRVKTVES